MRFYDKIISHYSYIVSNSAGDKKVVFIQWNVLKWNGASDLTEVYWSRL